MTESRIKAAGQSWPAAVLGVVLLASSCSSRPSPEDWEAQWQALLEQIPPVDTMLAADDASRRLICSETLGHLRASVTEIEYGPNADVEHAALNFLEFAEAVFFDCPIARGEHAGFPAGYQEMDRLIAAVDALIAFGD